MPPVVAHLDAEPPPVVLKAGQQSASGTDRAVTTEVIRGGQAGRQRDHARHRQVEAAILAEQAEFDVHPGIAQGKASGTGYGRLGGSVECVVEGVPRLVDRQWQTHAELEAVDHAHGRSDVSRKQIPYQQGTRSADRAGLVVDRQDGEGAPGIVEPQTHGPVPVAQRRSWLDRQELVRSHRRMKQLRRERPIGRRLLCAGRDGNEKKQEE